MTRIKLRHQFTDPKVIDSNLTGVGGTPDCVDLTIKHNLQRVEFSLCTVDIEALASAIGYNLIKVSSDSRLMENKADIISSSIDDKGITTVKIKRDEE